MRMTGLLESTSPAPQLLRMRLAEADLGTISLDRSKPERTCA
ncbi:hypothetical protein BIWAKO_02979 [Bosea sp. BIWAKO-01]|nr:hypothetical protein BIWAKO_02979 [Bosea sp. BIWAKO-01]